MKSNILSKFRGALSRTLPIAVLSCAIVFLSTVTSFAQNNNADEGNLSVLSGKEWKSAADAVLVLQEQLDHSEAVLSDSQLNADEKSVQMLHKRVSSVVMDELQSGNSVYDSVVKGYKKVEPEVLKNPDLTLVPEGYLDIYILVLSELLSAVPVMITVEGN